MNKYYLHDRIGISSSGGNSYIIRNSPNIEMRLREYVEMPYFGLDIDKLEEGKIKRPQNSKFDKYKEIIKETYDDYFNLALKTIRTCKWETAEYYLDQKSPTFTYLIMYTTDPKNKFCLDIDIRDSSDILMVTLGMNEGFSHRPAHRRKSTPISESIFISALKETIKFIEDENSYHINMKDYLKNIKMILDGNITETTSENLTNVDLLINQLELKRRDITNRLIKNDSDTENTRASLRGEKEGIEYSLKAIKKFFRLNLS